MACRKQSDSPYSRRVDPSTSLSPVHLAGICMAGVPRPHRKTATLKQGCLDSLPFIRYIEKLVVRSSHSHCMKYEHNKRLVLGADGGGTKTLGILAA